LTIIDKKTRYPEFAKIHLTASQPPKGEGSLRRYSPHTGREHSWGQAEDHHLILELLKRRDFIIIGRLRAS